MTEDERLISYRCGYGYPDPGVIISAPNQVYFYGRTDYTWTEEGAGEEEEIWTELDPSTITLPSGATNLSIYNLHGGSLRMVNGSEEVVFETSDNFYTYLVWETHDGIRESIEKLGPDPTINLEGLTWNFTREGYELVGIFAKEEGEGADTTVTKNPVWATESQLKKSGTAECTVEVAAVAKNVDSPAVGDTRTIEVNFDLTMEDLYNDMSTKIDSAFNIQSPNYLNEIMALGVIPEDASESSWFETGDSDASLRYIKDGETNPTYRIFINRPDQQS